MQNIRMPLWWAIGLTLLVNAASMMTPVINEGDSVVYAALSQYIAVHGNWMDLVLDQKDWLDKPHFPFWITALFFKIGGISAFTYILPGYLFHLLGAYFTYRIARLLYGRDTALLALFLYVSTLNLMLTSSAVRAEAYLVGSITAACYYWLRFDAQARLKYLVLGALFTAMAVMTKGIFTLITIGSGLVCLWLYQKRWRMLWSGKWLLALCVSFVFTAPELVALYLQFDAHPEKVVFGQTQVSGVRFFLWDSQFGRFFNSGPIKSGEGSPLYYTHVFLWTFLPWVGVFLAAMYSALKTFTSQSAADRASLIFLSASFLVTFALFSATSFQVDYYIVIVFPFALILCAHYLSAWLQLDARSGRKLYAAQIVITLCIIALSWSLGVYVGKAWLQGVLLALSCSLLLMVVVFRHRQHVYAVLIYPVFAVNMLYVFLELMTWSVMTTYGVAYNVNRLLSNAPTVPIYVYQMDEIVAWELALYNKAPSFAFKDVDELPKKGSFVVVARDRHLPELGARLDRSQLVGKGEWINHKTGMLPRQLRLAKGVEPVEAMSIVRISGLP